MKIDESLVNIRVLMYILTYPLPVCGESSKPTFSHLKWIPILARCIVELERIYGIRHGNNQRTLHNVNSSKTQKEFASESKQDNLTLIKSDKDYLGGDRKSDLNNSNLIKFR
ncbi:hypothetical protein P9274_01050 [Schinkia azotoformans]|uniref:hypothetical protein n=1 Tax=Schinkia azotoformans TaxID=1454 RepID=UPI002E2263D1|nr:hypothetical protein [Schinkia azotoformans]